MSYIEIGGTPHEESCAQIGQDQPVTGPRHNRLECQAFIQALRLKYGVEPPGAELRTKSYNHDFGTYREVVCHMEDGNAAALAYAQRVEHGLATWAEVGMWAPVLYGDRGHPVSVIEDPERWLIANNPQGHPETPVG